MNHSALLRSGIVLALVSLAVACSDDEEGASNETAGGTSGIGGAGGRASGSGGKAATGGKAGVGGATAAGGKAGVGGAVTGVGGAVTGVGGGTTAAGGKAGVGGGVTGVGGGVAGSGVGGAAAGSTATGGVTTNAGAPAAGSTATGGVPSTGGSPSVAGSTATGGVPSTGGSPSIAGATSVAGAPGTAGAAGAAATDPFAGAAKFPAIGATEVPVDAWFSLTFDAPPTLGTTGHIYVRKVEDGSQVDVINLADAPNAAVRIGSAAAATVAPTACNYTAGGATAGTFRACYVSQTNLADFGFNTTVNYLGNDAFTYGRTTAGRVRIVKYNPVKVVGNQLRIYPHDGLLAYNTAHNTAYYITIDNGAVIGTLGGAAFTGVTSTAWNFTTKTAVPTGTAWTVNANGTSGDFMTIQGAINAVPVSNPSTITVTVADGTYEELLYNYAKNNLVINGTSRAGTILKYENWEGFLPGTGGGLASSTSGTPYTTPNGDAITVPIATTTPLYEGGRALIHMQSATGVEMNNLTVRNSHVRDTSASSNAAETIYFNNDSGTFISRNSNWLSTQDTLQFKGYSWFYNSLIAGDVDFIWGTARVALFEGCEIRSTGAGYVVNSRTATGYGGFIFLGSTFTADAGVAAGGTYLARHNGGTYPDNVVLSNCALGTHIAAAGFTGTPGTATSTPVAGLRYYGLTDTAATPAPWSTAGLISSFYPLTADENTGLYGARDKIYSATTVSYTTSSYLSMLWTLTP